MDHRLEVVCPPSMNSVNCGVVPNTIAGRLALWKKPMSITKSFCAPPLRAKTSWELTIDAGALYHGACTAPLLTLNSVAAPSVIPPAKVMTAPGEAPLRTVTLSTGLTAVGFVE